MTLSSTVVPKERHRMTALSVAEPRDDPGEGGGPKTPQKGGFCSYYQRLCMKNRTFGPPYLSPGFKQ